MATAGALPDEVWTLVLSKLSPGELSIARLVSKRFAALGKQPTLAPRQQQLQLALLEKRKDGAEFQKLLDHPAAQDALVHMRTLSLYGDYGRNDDVAAIRPLDLPLVEALLRCRQRGMRLRLLEFDTYELSDEVAMALLFGPDSRVLEGVEALGFESCEWTDGALRHLAACADLAALRSLCLDNSFPWEDSSIAALAAAPSLRGLRSLSLQSCEAYRPAFTILAAPPGIESLTFLRLSDNDLAESWEGEEEQEPPPPPAARAATLSELCLRNTGIAAANLAGIVEFPPLARLAHLDLSMNVLGPDGAASVAAAPVLQRLRKLNLARCQVADGGARALAGSRTLTGLTDLVLDSNGLNDEAAASLAASEGLAGLARLSLRDNRGVTEEGRRLLQHSSKLTALRSLDLAEDGKLTCDCPLFPM